MAETTEEKLTLRNRIIGVLLRDARERAGKSKRECAEAVGVSTDSITAFEEGSKPISLPELEILAYVTHTPTSHFLGHTPELVPEEESLQLEEIMALRHRIVGALLRQARLDADMTQKDLADVLGCSPSQISSYEYGERPVSLAELELLARHLNLPIEYFIDSQGGSVGQWHQQQEAWRRFLELPREVQEFVARPTNVKYLEVAMRLDQMPVGTLRAIAEGLLEITY
jgi:transcriptional regulator with XRE-family HTH domain